MNQLMLKMVHFLMLSLMFWEYGQKALFDVKVFNPLAPLYCSISLPQCYRQAELEKEEMYKERIWEVEHRTFTPLVFHALEE